MIPSATVEEISVQTHDMRLSGLLAMPSAGLKRPLDRRPQGLILALHGGGYSAGYWNCPADGASLLKLGARLGFCVLALDRPGYGLSQQFTPSRLRLAAQVEFLFDAIDAWSASHRFDGPKFVIGHSIGGILALLMSAHPRGQQLSGIDVLGVPIRFADTEAGNEVQSWATSDSHVPVLSETLRKPILFGPPDTYSTEADAYDRTLLRPMPVAEYLDAIAMPDAWPGIMPTIRLPVQFSVAEFEAMQVTGLGAVETARAQLSGSRHCVTRLQVAAGHNASVHRIARAYHLQAIAFFEECLALQSAGDRR